MVEWFREQFLKAMQLLYLIIGGFQEDYQREEQHLWNQLKLGILVIKQLDLWPRVIQIMVRFTLQRAYILLMFLKQEAYPLIMMEYLLVQELFLGSIKFMIPMLMAITILHQSIVLFLFTLQQASTDLEYPLHLSFLGDQPKLASLKQEWQNIMEKVQQESELYPHFDYWVVFFITVNIYSHLFVLSQFVNFYLTASQGQLYLNILPIILQQSCSSFLKHSQPYKQGQLLHSPITKALKLFPKLYIFPSYCNSIELIKYILEIDWSFVQYLLSAINRGGSLEAVD